MRLVAAAADFHQPVIPELISPRPRHHRTCLSFKGTCVEAPPLPTGWSVVGHIESNGVVQVIDSVSLPPKKRANQA